jgi:hypothetical protein
MLVLADGTSQGTVGADRPGHRRRLARRDRGQRRRPTGPGAIQCGFCTPGLIMATKALLDRDPDPDLKAIKRALARNLCRCTGYPKIIDAVRLAGRFLRGETTPEDYRRGLGGAMVGVSHPRPSAMLKACGLAQFAGDIQPANAAELAVVRSTHYHAVVKSVDTTAASMMPGQYHARRLSPDPRTAAQPTAG